MKANVTEDGHSYKAVQRVACTASLHGEYFLYPLSVVNVLLAITAFLENAVIRRGASKEEFPSSAMKTHVPVPGNH